MWPVYLPPPRSRLLRFALRNLASKPLWLHGLFLDITGHWLPRLRFAAPEAGILFSWWIWGVNPISSWKRKRLPRLLFGCPYCILRFMRPHAALLRQSGQRPVYDVQLIYIYMIWSALNFNFGFKLESPVESTRSADGLVWKFVSQLIFSVKTGRSPLHRNLASRPGGFVWVWPVPHFDVPWLSSVLWSGENRCNSSGVRQKEQWLQSIPCSARSSKPTHRFTTWEVWVPFWSQLFPQKTQPYEIYEI